MTAPRRVVITGCGVVTPAGNELRAFWDALMSGTCFIEPLTAFTTPGVENLRGASVTLPPEDALPAAIDPDARRARCAELALAAARRAIADAALGATGLERTGVVLGTTLAEERQSAELNERFIAAAPDGASAVDAGFFTRADSHHLAALVAREHGLGGPVLLNATACSSGNAAAAWAFDLVASGEADMILAGGADTFTRVIYGGFTRMSALSKSVCKPFDKNRDGVSFGEGAGMFVLEEREHARARGARIYAELAGYGTSNDAHHITAPEPTGDGVVRAMRQALATSGTPLESVDYVSAHGTGTAYNDLGETLAMTAVFGERTKKIPMSSIKSMIGHTNGAAGAIESVACALALMHQAVPPTANLVEPDPAFGPGFDFVPGKGRAARVTTCINLASGFGGSNVCLILKEHA